MPLTAPLLITSAVVTALSLARPQSSPIDRAAWIAGCWELRGPGRLTMEMWMPPAGGTMMGSSRTVIGGNTREFEHLRLSIDGQRLVYTAVPSGQKETAFPSIQISDTMVVFENLQHDFPQRIIYRKRGADSLIARIEGPGPNNTTRGSNFPMGRASCTTPPAPPPPAPAPDTVMFDADLSPDGRQLLLVKGVGQNFDVYIAGPDGANPRKLTDAPQVDYQAAWSPDGRRIVFASAREGHQEIYTMRPDGSELTQLTRGTAHNSAPSWSADGRSIVFTSERDGRAQVYLMAADGSGQRALTRDSIPSTAPSLSPDGRSIAFASPRNGHAEVHVMNADGTGSRQLTTTAVGHSAAPAWSRDGRTIAFWSTRDGNDELYVMNADGSNQRNITNHAARDAILAWTPDGTHILFRSTRDRAANDIYRIKPDGTGLARVTTSK